MFGKITEIPTMIYTDIVDMTKSVQKKIRGFANAQNNRNDVEYYAMVTNHFNYLQSLRLNQPDRYVALVAFVQYYNQLDIDQQPAAIVSYFGANQVDFHNAKKENKEYQE